MGGGMMVQDNRHWQIVKLLREETVLRPADQDALLAMGSDIIGILIEVLDGNQPRQLVNAMSVLEQIGGCHAAKALPALLALQSHAHPWVRMSSAKAIGILGSEDDADALINWLNAEHDVLVQIWIVISLGKLESTRSVDPLIHALQRTESSTMRYTIIRALGDLGDARAADAIRAYLNDEDRHVRKDAQQALLKLEGHGGSLDG